MEANEILSQFTAAAVSVYAIQALKSSSLVPWITQRTTGLNRLLSALGAFIGAIGVHFAFGASQSVDGTYVLTVTGATVSNVLHGLWHWANQVALQQLTYDAVVAKTSAQTPQAVAAVPLPPSAKAELRQAKDMP